MKNFISLLCMTFVIIFFSCTFSFSQNNGNLTVLVKYKTQSGKEIIALNAIKNLVAKVSREPNYINITILVDPTDTSNILLYEQWSNEEYYKGDHLNTSHLQQFIVDSSAFLAGPPDISFWKNTD